MTDIEVVKNAQRLHHIILAVQRIRRSMSGVTWETFATNEDKQGNVVRCLEVIGEASNHVAEEIRNANPGIPWASIIGMRNNLVHGYNEVNYRLVWRTVQNDLRVLEETIPQIIGKLPLPSDFVPPELPTVEL
ncbi:MAG: DUF86 domain-containing protein [Kiritimatiellia bacterium]